MQRKNQKLKTDLSATNRFPDLPSFFCVICWLVSTYGTASVVHYWTKNSQLILQSAPLLYTCPEFAISHQKKSLLNFTTHNPGLTSSQSMNYKLAFPTILFMIHERPLRNGKYILELFSLDVFQPRNSEALYFLLKIDKPWVLLTHWISRFLAANTISRIKYLSNFLPSKHNSKFKYKTGRKIHLNQIIFLYFLCCILHYILKIN